MYAALLDYLLKVDLSGFDPRAVPKTEGLRSQMSESLTGAEAAWYECLQRGEIPGSMRDDGTVLTRSAALLSWAARTDHRWASIRDEHLGHLLGANPRMREDRHSMGFKKIEVHERSNTGRSGSIRL